MNHLRGEQGLAAFERIEVGLQRLYDADGYIMGHQELLEMARDVRGLNFLGLRMTFSSLERIQFFYLETLSTSDLEFLLTWFAYQVSRIEQVVSEPLAQPLEDRRKLDSGGAVMRHEPQASPEVGSVDSGAPSGVVIPFTNPRMSA